MTGLQVHASDSASGETLTYTAAGLPAGLSISSSGLISGTPTATGTSHVTVTATDSTGAAGSATFTWTVGGGSHGWRRLPGRVQHDQRMVRRVHRQRDDHQHWRRRGQRLDGEVLLPG
ncbi:Ig domain-containing protein [Streptomyces sp. NBC_01198]|uniref:Ig domain-containing protein n=1 Tax=Streptomyces sp. NBC_01198 TaxID=2903769 RepID=UPI002E14396E|nr:Ig domain-containing protein [Streptomyces sp. NBC_01198]